MLLNYDRATKLMERDGLEAIIATTPENLTYGADFFGIKPYIYREVEMYVVIPADQRIEPAFIVPIDVLDVLAQQPTWIKDVRIYGTYHIYGSPDADLTRYERILLDMRHNLPHYDSAQDALVSVLEDKQLARKNLGLDELTVSPRRQESIRQRLPEAQIKPCFQLFHEIRAVKTPDHINLIEKAAQILERGMEAGIEALRNGGTELAIWEACAREVASQGAIPSHWETTAGTRSAACFPPSNYRLKSGDLIRFEGGCRYKWNFADTGRTGVVGKPTAEQQKLFDAIMTGQQAALEEIRPGVTPTEIFEADVQAVQRAGLSGYRRHHVGHGIGLEMYEIPLLSPKAKSDIHKLGGGEVYLEPNMVVNVETPYYHLGVGGIQIEDTLVVTENGFRYLTHAPRHLREILI